MAMLAVKFLCELLPNINRIPNPIILRAFVSGKGGVKKGPCAPTSTGATTPRECKTKQACPSKPCPPPEPSCCPPSKIECLPPSPKPPSPPSPSCPPTKPECPCPSTKPEDSYCPKSRPSPSPPLCPSPAISGKVAVITGGSRGIGLNCALAILKNGGKVMLGDVRVDEGKQAIYKIVEKFGYDKAAFIRSDVTKVEDMECLFDAALCEFGRIDIVINNAGIFQEKYWAEACDVNMKGVICGTLLGFKHMRKNRNGGTIINVSSIAGFDPCHVGPVYVGTKQFVKGFSRSMGHDYYYCQTGVKVMTLCPGETMTPIQLDPDENLLDGFDLTKELDRLLMAITMQSAKVCGMHIVPILEANINGSDWISEEGEIYRVKRVDRKTLRIS